MTSKKRPVMIRPKVCPGCKKPFPEATESLDSMAFKITAVVHFKDKEGKELRKEFKTPVLCAKCIEEVINDEILAHTSGERYAQRCLKTINRFRSEHPELIEEGEQ